MRTNINYSRKYEASPQFAWTNANTITAGSIVVLDWAEYKPASRKYLPFNLTRIVNNGEDDIKIYINQDPEREFYIAKGTIMTFDRSAVPALSSLKIEHVGSTDINANKISITSSNEGQTSDSIVSRLHKRIIGRLMGGY